MALRPLEMDERHLKHSVPILALHQHLSPSLLTSSPGLDLVSVSWSRRGRTTVTHRTENPILSLQDGQQQSVWAPVVAEQLSKLEFQLLVMVQAESNGAVASKLPKMHL